jgi:hypothetical protein
MVFRVKGGEKPMNATQNPAYDILLDDKNAIQGPAVTGTSVYGLMTYTVNLRILSTLLSKTLYIGA